MESSGKKKQCSNGNRSKIMYNNIIIIIIIIQNKKEAIEVDDVWRVHFFMPRRPLQCTPGGRWRKDQKREDGHYNRASIRLPGLGLHTGHNEGEPLRPLIGGNWPPVVIVQSHCVDGCFQKRGQWTWGLSTQAGRRRAQIEWQQTFGCVLFRYFSLLRMDMNFVFELKIKA